MFTLGVASGDPAPSSVVLWTRLAPDPLHGGGMTDGPVQVSWRVATDPGFVHVVRRGTATARATLAHSVHVVASGLVPDHEYWFQFKAGRELSPVGRTRTLPSPSAAPERLAFAVANCQDWQNGYWPAYDALAAEDVAFVLHLGDYIYEYDPASAYSDRLHTTPDTPGLDQLSTLADYRNRHALYKTDVALQRAHAAFPFWVVPDDHEVENNYAGLVDEIDDTGAKFQGPAAFALQRAAAYQAYYEHMPLRPTSRPRNDGIRLYRSFDYGCLAKVLLLDTRQYRTDQPGGFPNDLGPEAAGDANVDGTLTGPLQEGFLGRRLRRSSAIWNVLGQQTITAQIRLINPPPASLAILDQWDGYEPFRRRILAAVATSGATNPVVLTGDIHSSWVNDLKVDFDDAAGAVIGSEFVCTSISSDFPAAFIPLIAASNAAFNPHVRFFDGSRRGYLRCTLTEKTWLSEFRTVDTIATRQAPTTTTARWVVEAGRPGAQPA